MIRLQRPPDVQIQVNKPRIASAPHQPYLAGGAHASSRCEGRAREMGAEARGARGMGRAEANDDARATHAFQREFIPPHAIAARVDSAICTDTGAQSNCHKAAAKSPQAPRQAALIEPSAKTPKKNVTSQAATKGQWTVQHTVRGSWHPCRGKCQAPLKHRKLWGDGLGRTPRGGRDRSIRYLRANTYTHGPPPAYQPT